MLLAKNPEGVSEVVNDINRDLVNFWHVLKEDGAFMEFKRLVEATPFCEEEYRDAAYRVGHDQLDVFSPHEVRVQRAVEFFIFCRQSLAGRMKGFTGVTKTRVRRGMNNEVSAWLTAVEGLPAVHGRLKRVLILNREALDVIRGQDGPDSLFYCDPPYLHETRATTGEYAHEMTAEQHAALLDVLACIKGKFLLSGYHSGMYDRAAALAGWRVREFDLPNQAAGGKEKRRMTECVWANYAPPAESQGEADARPDPA